MKDELETKKVLSSIALLPQTMSAILTHLKGKGNNTQEVTNPVEGTSRFVKAEDTTKIYQKKSITKLSELINVSKDILKKKTGDWTTGLGKLLMAGGLLGFLLTGKTEFLTSMVKGFEKLFVLPVARIIDKFVMKLSSSFLKYGTSAAAKLGAIFSKMIPKVPKVPRVIRQASKILEKGGELSAKIITKLGGSVDAKGKLRGRFGWIKPENLVKEAEEIALKEAEQLAVKSTAKVSTKFGIKGLLKGGSKLGLKALAKIPFLGMILGPVLGIMFAVERYKKGDYIGALGEIASGMAMLLPPGVGTFISLGIDALLLLRDFKSPEAIKEDNKKFTKKFTKKNIEAFFPQFNILRHMKKMNELWKTDKKGSIKEAALAFGQFFPFFSFVEGAINFFGDDSELNVDKSGGGRAGSSGANVGGVAPSAAGGTVNAPVNRLLKQGSNKFVQTTQQLNIPTGKMQNKYKFNAPWDKVIDKETKGTPISSDVIRSMIMQESGGDPNKVNAYSGATGLGQFMPGTAKDWLEGGFASATNPEKSIHGMVRYMKHLYKQAGGDKNPNAIFKAIYDYHGHGQSSEGDISSGSYVHEIASRMGISAPIGMMSSGKTYRTADKKEDNPYNFGVGFSGGAGTVAINSPAMAPEKLKQNLKTINTLPTQYVDPYMTELIKATKDNSITFKSALEGLSIKSNQNFKNDSAG